MDNNTFRFYSVPPKSKPHDGPPRYSILNYQKDSTGQVGLHYCDHRGFLESAGLQNSCDCLNALLHSTAASWLCECMHQHTCVQIHAMRESGGSCWVGQSIQGVTKNRAHRKRSALSRKPLCVLPILSIPTQNFLTDSISKWRIVNQHISEWLISEWHIS